MSEKVSASSANSLFFYVLMIMVPLTLYTENKYGEIVFRFPLIEPQNWCDTQPCVEFTNGFVLVQPTSSIFVYLLGLITIYIGSKTLNESKEQLSKYWWGLALVFWGLGALIAGTSYQAFSFQLKCVDRFYCEWTTWLEVYYMVLTVASVNSMLIAQSHIRANGKDGIWMVRYAYGNLIAYIVIVLNGSLISVQSLVENDMADLANFIIFLIRFEMMIIFLAPTILFLLIYNYRYYQENKTILEKNMVIIYLSLGGIMLAYFLYLFLGITESLWENGIWFSENDVLHILLILWMVYIKRKIIPIIKDQKST